MGVVFKLFIQLCVSHAMRFRIAGDDFVPPLSRLSAHFPQRLRQKTLISRTS